MARVESTITIKNEFRPCYVDGNKKALFHRWAERTETIIKLNNQSSHAAIEVNAILEMYYTKHVLPACCDIETETTTFAIVEYENGDVAEVAARRIKFADNIIKEYAF